MRFSRGKRPLTPIVSVGGVGWRIEKLPDIRAPLALRQWQALAEQPAKRLVQLLEVGLADSA